MRTVTGLSHQPFTIAAAATATALEPGGARLPRAALPDERGHLVQAVDPHELDVRPLREALVHLDQRAEPQQRRRDQARAHDRMRVADRDGGQLDPLVRRARSSPSRRTSTSPTRIAIVPSSRIAAGYMRPPTEIVTASDPARRASQRGSDAGAVAGELGERAVRVPDHDLGVRVRRRSSTSSTPSAPIP